MTASELVVQGERLRQILDAMFPTRDISWFKSTCDRILISNQLRFETGCSMDSASIAMQDWCSNILTQAELENRADLKLNSYGYVKLKDRTPSPVEVL